MIEQVLRFEINLDSRERYYCLNQCRADELQVSVKAFDFAFGRASVVELTIACELECVVVSIDMHNDPG